jgi:hypothetical protein
MKRYTQQLAVVSFLLFNAPVLAGCWMNTYWPLNDGDYKTFSYSGGELDLSVYEIFDTLYQVEWVAPPKPAFEWEQIEGDSLYLIKAGVPYISITFTPEVLLLDDALLMSGGSRTTKTTVSQSGVTYPATFTVTATPAGTVTVPAGTYANCLNLTASETATVPGQGTVSETYMTAVIAPRVGLIKKLVTPNVWASLVSGTVGGVDVTNLTGANVLMLPVISSQPQSVSVTHGSTVKLSASATGGAGVSYRWLKDGVALQDGSRVSGTAGPVLTISPALSVDAGSYRLSVSNAACSVLSTAAVVQVMADKPKLGISFPSSSQRVSNSVVIVRGTASDNLGVSNVMVRIGAGPWVTTASTNHWTNWTAEVSLASVGTNRVQAWTADLEGVQTWASNTFVYVMSDRLRMAATGQGTVSPNYNGAWLEIGKSYTMTATGTNGHRFDRWEVSTNWAGPVTNLSPKLSFIMESNLTIAVFFADTNRPTVAVTNLVANQRISNAVFTVRGTAKDNVRVSAVWWQTNGGSWSLASTTNGWTNWTANLALWQRTNTLQACAVDGTGNRSVTNTVKIVYVASDRLTVIITGQGTVSNNYNNALLEIGTLNQMTATAGRAYLFSNWVGSAGEVLTNGRTLQFIMQSNLVLTANFVPNPFILVAGTYQGLFYNTGGVEQASAGFFSGSVTTNGLFSAKFQQGLRSNALSGQFSLTGVWYTNAIKGWSNTAVWLQLDLTGGDAISGSLSNALWTASLWANRAVYSKTNPAPQAGKYTLALPGSANAQDEPGGDGYGSASVDTNGNVTFMGMLGDGTKVTGSAIVSKEGQWAVYIPLYSGQGSLLGWLTFTNQADGDLEGLMNWIKPAHTGSNPYPAGFTNQTDTVGSHYGFTNGVRALVLTNGVLILEGGNTASGPNGLSLTITNATGLFQGSLTNSLTGKIIKINGAVLQKLNAGYGTFLGTNQSGSVSLEQK